jgi:hypothetical protein
MALKKAQEEIIWKHWLSLQDKDDLQTKFEENKEQIQQDKEQLLAEQVRVKEAFNKEIHSVTSLEKMEEDLVVNKFVKLVESIQQLQQRVA